MSINPQSNHTSMTNIDDYLACLQVVMVNTTLPANIGSAARAMHTMGLTGLTVVNPKHPIDETSTAHAAGGIDVLSSAVIAGTLESAIADCHLTFAASSRSRHLPRPVVTPTEAAKIMLDFINKQSSLDESRPKIAILFGREDRGLTNEELACADYHIQIDANPAYPVLNVASAVQVIASFIYAYARSFIDANNDVDNSANSSLPILNTYVRQQWDEPAITHHQLQHLTERTTALMVQNNLADAEHLRSLPSRLSRLGSRIQLDQKEYQLLSALIAKIAKK